VQNRIDSCIRVYELGQQSDLVHGCRPKRFNYNILYEEVVLF
jgi:hypothetical protein